VNSDEEEFQKRSGLVTVLSGYGLDDRGSILDRGGDFLSVIAFRKPRDTFSLLSIGYRRFYLGVNQTEHETDH
jgi:hypothetical protein